VDISIFGTKMEVVESGRTTMRGTSKLWNIPLYDGTTTPQEEKEETKRMLRPIPEQRQSKHQITTSSWSVQNQGK
jgi:hypothetical protein